MEATELRLKADEFEQEISALVIKFMQEVGQCDIQVSINPQYSISLGEKIFTSPGVSVYVTV